MENTTSTFDASDPTTPGHYRAAQTALLLLDFHSLFVQHAGGPNTKAALAVASHLRTWAKSQSITVIHCLIDVNASPFSTCKGAQRLAGVIATAKSTGGDKEPVELFEGGSEGEITFMRQPGHVSALKSPGLEKFLQTKGIKSLVLTGLSTSGCVMRTAVAACDAEFVVTTISDGCAEPTEGVHEIMIGKILNNRGWVVTAEDFRRGFEQAQGSARARP